MTEKKKAILHIAFIVLVLAAIAYVVLFMFGCANTEQAVADIRLMVQEQRAAIVRYEAQGGQNAETLRKVADTAEVAAAGIEAIKEAELEDLKIAAEAAGKAGLSSLLGPGAGDLAMQLGLLAFGGLGVTDSLKQRKKRGISETLRVNAEAKVRALNGATP